MGLPCFLGKLQEAAEHGRYELAMGDGVVLDEGKKKRARGDDFAPNLGANVPSWPLLAHLSDSASAK